MNRAAPLSEKSLESEQSEDIRRCENLNHFTLTLGFIMADLRTTKSLDIVETLVSMIADQTNEARSSAAFNRWIEVQKSFWRYSWNNTLLMAYQAKGYGFPLTRVAGSTKWQSMGRKVTGAAWGQRLWILAPVFKKIEDKSTGETRNLLTGFRSVYVFDQSQTEGDDLPKLDSAAKGGDAGLVAALEGEFARKGIDLSYFSPALMRASHGGALGVSMGKTVRILDTLQGAERASVLAHELAHSILHFKDGSSLDRDHSTSTMEIEAESISACILGAWGLDWRPQAMYLAAWGGDKTRVRESMGRIASTAKSILERILPAEE